MAASRSDWSGTLVALFQPAEEHGGGAQVMVDDDLYEKAVAVAVQYRKVSASLLQRRLGIGYPRAAKLADLLEDRGIIGPSEDGRSRELIEAEPVPADEDLGVRV